MPDKWATTVQDVMSEIDSYVASSIVNDGNSSAMKVLSKVKLRLLSLYTDMCNETKKSHEKKHVKFSLEADFNDEGIKVGKLTNKAADAVKTRCVKMSWETASTEELPRNRKMWLDEHFRDDFSKAEAKAALEKSGTSIPEEDDESAEAKKSTPPLAVEMSNASWMFSKHKELEKLISPDSFIDPFRYEDIPRATNRFVSLITNLFSIFFSTVSETMKDRKDFHSENFQNHRLTRFLQKLFDYCEDTATRRNVCGTIWFVSVVLCQTWKKAPTFFATITLSQLLATLFAAMLSNITRGAQSPKISSLFPFRELFLGNKRLLSENYATFIGLTLALGDDESNFLQIVEPGIFATNDTLLQFEELVLSICNATHASQYSLLTNSIYSHSSTRTVHEAESLKLNFLRAVVHLGFQGYHFCLPSREYVQSVGYWSLFNNVPYDDAAKNSNSTNISEKVGEAGGVCAADCQQDMVTYLMKPLLTLLEEKFFGEALLQQNPTASGGEEESLANQLAFNSAVVALPLILPLEWMQLMDGNYHTTDMLIRYASDSDKPTRHLHHQRQHFSSLNPMPIMKVLSQTCSCVRTDKESIAQQKEVEEHLRSMQASSNWEVVPHQEGASPNQSSFSRSTCYYILIRFLLPEVLSILQTSVPHRRAEEKLIDQFTCNWLSCLIQLQERLIQNQSISETIDDDSAKTTNNRRDDGDCNQQEALKPFVVHPSNTNSIWSSKVELEKYFFQGMNPREAERRRMEWYQLMAITPPPHPQATQKYQIDPIVLALTQIWSGILQQKSLLVLNLSETMNDSTLTNSRTSMGPNMQVSKVLSRFRDFDQRLRNDPQAKNAWERSKSDLFRM